jgi:SNF2 family DNA or RNA helicase
MRRLQALLKAVMLRRTKSSKIDGKPIIQLPPKTEYVDHVVFSEDQEKYYRDLEKDSQVKFSKYLKNGSVGKHYSVVLVLLLRLRQACCHPHLHITDLDYGSNEVPEDEMIKLAKTLGPDVVKRIGEIDAFECPICYEPVENPSIMLPCGHDTCAECLVRLTGNAEQQNLQAGVEDNRTRCPECRGPVNAKEVITYEIFKQVFLPEEVNPLGQGEPGSADDSDETTSEEDDETASEEGDDDADERGNLRNFVVSDDVDDDDSNLDQELKKGLVPTKAEKGESKPKKKSRKKKKGKKAEKEVEVQPHMLAKLRKEAAKNAKAHRVYMRYLEKIWEPSAKVTKCTELIKSFQDTGEKTIVFSQWTLLLDLLEVPIRRELELGLRRYDGGMSAQARDDAVRAFTENDDVKVMLVSLKAGNAGLNLTAASRVIIMDPFWNPYIEAQAVDRAHRMGQLKAVSVHRVLVENTVEDRIVALQEKKRELVDSALDESAAKSIGRLSAQDLAYLFGVHT